MKRALIALIGLIGCAIIGGCIAWAINDHSMKIRQRYPVEWRMAPNAKVTFNGVSRPDSLVYVSDAGDLLIFQDETLPFLIFREKRKHAIMVAEDFYVSGKTVRSVPVPRISMMAGSMKGENRPLVVNADGYEFTSVGYVIIRVVVNNAD